MWSYSEQSGLYDHPSNSSGSVYDIDERFDSSSDSESCDSTPSVGKRLPPGYTLSDRRNVQEKEQEMIQSVVPKVDYELVNYIENLSIQFASIPELANVIENLPIQFASNPVDESFVESLGGTTKRFMRAVNEVTSELLEFALLCREQGVTFGASQSKKGACVLSQRYMLFHSSLSHLFIHQDNQNNGPNTLSINVTSLHGHVLISSFILALKNLVSIQFITMPVSSRLTSTVVHCCLETQADFKLACQFMTYFNTLHPSVFSRFIPETNAKGETVAYTMGDNLAAILNLAPSKGKKKDSLTQWERKPVYVPRKTFGMELIDGDFYIVVRGPKPEDAGVRNWTEMTNVVSSVPITSVIQWIVHEMGNGRYNNTESPTKSIAHFKVINFDNTFNQGDVQFKTVHHNALTGMWSIQLKDKFQIQFQPTGILFDQIHSAVVAEVEIEQQEMESESDSELTMDDYSSESGDCNRSRNSPRLLPRQPFKLPMKTFKNPASVPSFPVQSCNNINYHASAVQSFSNTPSPTMSTITEQYYHQPLYFGMMPTAQAMPLVPLSFPTQPLFQYATCGMNVQQPVLNFAPTVNCGLPNQ